MELTVGVVTFLLLAAIAVAIASAMGRAPLWLAVILLCLVEAAHFGLLT